MYTTDSKKLLNVVNLLMQKKAEIDSFFEATTFSPYDIDIGNCLITQNLGDTKRLLDLSFTTRQGGQNKAAIKNYEEKNDNILEKLKFSMALLLDESREPAERYEMALGLINSIENVGQKIATMFLKFLVYYSKGFPRKEELERELFIPFDSHVIKLLFTKVDGQTTNRLNLYDGSINQAALYYDIHSTSPFTFRNTKLIKLQRNIRDDFDELEIKEPPIILDYLWYAGSMYCSKSFGDIGCRICFLKDDCQKPFGIR